MPVGELKAKPSGGGGSGLSRRSKRTDHAGQQAFNGILELSPAEFDRFEECMTNPGDPTEAMHKAAAQLRKLYR